MFLFAVHCHLSSLFLLQSFRTTDLMYICNVLLISVQLYLNFIANLALGAKLYFTGFSQDPEWSIVWFHCAFANILSLSVLLLCYFFSCKKRLWWKCLSPRFSHVLKKVVDHTWNGHFCSSTWKFLNVSKFKCLMRSGIIWEVREKVLSICFRIVLLEAVSHRTFFRNCFQRILAYSY